jgi:hypothetical protein
MVSISLITLGKSCLASMRAAKWVDQIADQFTSLHLRSSRLFLLLTACSFVSPGKEGALVTWFVQQGQAAVSGPQIGLRVIENSLRHRLRG